MSTRGQMHEHDCGQNAAAYVLDALETEEAVAFRRHLETCVVCRDEVAALRAAADALPMAAPQLLAPRSLKRKLMKTVRAEARQQASEQRRGWAFPTFAVGRPAAALGALATAAVIALAVIELVPGGSSGTRIVQASVPGTSAVATLRVNGTRGELALSRMPKPPAGRIYEVWLKRGDQAPAPTSTLFSVTSRGSATVGVPGNLRGVTQVLVTPEPLGGSVVPTHVPVIIAQVPKL